MIEKVLLAFSDDGVATVTLNNPPLNIYDLEMRDGLIEAITAVRDHPDARVLVLQTEAKHFSAGADLSLGSRSLASAPRLTYTDSCGFERFRHWVWNGNGNAM